MKLLPISEIKVHITPDGMVLVAAYEHNGSLWWMQLPDPPRPSQRHHREPGPFLSGLGGAERADEL